MGAFAGDADAQRRGGFNDVDRETVTTYGAGVQRVRIASHHDLMGMLTDAGLDETTAAADRRGSPQRADPRTREQRHGAGRPRRRDRRMTLALTAIDLYQRGAETLVASWDVCAAGARGAAVVRGPGVRSGVFPHGPERDVFNNALLDRDLAADACEVALDAMEGAYASASVDRFAAWVYESDEVMRAAITARGYTVAETTRAMATPLSGLRLPRPEIDLSPASWPELRAVSRGVRRRAGPHGRRRPRRLPPRDRPG
jgi:hypothetical protein